MEYKFSTLKEIFDSVPSDRIEDCMAEIGRVMVYAANVRDLVNAIGEGVGVEAACEFLGVVTWIDDGKKNMTVAISDQSGDNAISIVARPSANA